MAFVHGSYHCKFELLGVLTLEAVGETLGPSTIVWSLDSAVMVSILSYEGKVLSQSSM